MFAATAAQRLLQGAYQLVLPAAASWATAEPLAQCLRLCLFLHACMHDHPACTECAIAVQQLIRGCAVE
jgi:hypothetical protein